MTTNDTTTADTPADPHAAAAALPLAVRLAAAQIVLTDAADKLTTRAIEAQRDDEPASVLFNADRAATLASFANELTDGNDAASAAARTRVQAVMKRAVEAHMHGKMMPHPYGRLDDRGGLAR